MNGKSQMIFFLYWKNKIRVYEDEVPCTDKWPDSMKAIMLENSVTLGSHLKQVKEMAEKLKTHSEGALSYYKCQQQLK